MKTIKEMSGAELRAFLGIESVSDSEYFDEWDAKYMSHDFEGANERRRDIIERLIEFAFCGTDDEDTLRIRSAIKDEEDAEIIAEELVNIDTYVDIWKTICEANNVVTEFYDGIDSYVDAARMELVQNIFGRYADEDAIQGLFDSFAIRLSYHRRKASLTQAQMSDRMQIPLRTIENWESATSTPPAYVQRMVLNELLSLYK